MCLPPTAGVRLVPVRPYHRTLGVVGDHYLGHSDYGFRPPVARGGPGCNAIPSENGRGVFV